MLEHADRLLLYYVAAACGLGVLLLLWERVRGHARWSLLSAGIALFLTATALLYIVSLRRWVLIDTPLPGHRDLLWLPRIAYAIGATLLVIGYGRRVWQQMRKRCPP